MGISNNKASNWPNFVINRIIKSKQEKTGAIILVDDNYTILNLWGLKNHSSNVVVLDKERICRYIYKGKLPAAEVEKLINYNQRVSGEINTPSALGVHCCLKDY